MNANDGLILVFTSNWEALYAQDAIDLLAQPENTLVHFRYRHGWIENELLSKIQREDADTALVGRRVLCIFVDRTIHTDVPIFVPTRFGTIRSVETEGSFVNLFFTVDRYFCWRSFAQRFCALNILTNQDLRQWINAFRQLAHADLNAGLRPGAELRGPPDKYMVEAGSSGPYSHESGIIDEGKGFEQLVAVLHTLPYFEHTIFFRIRAVEEFFSVKEYLHIFPLPFVSKSRFEAKKPTLVAAGQIAGGKFGFKFRRVVPYRLQVAIVNGKELSSVMKTSILEVSSDTRQVVVETPVIKIAAKNDFVRILLFPVFEAVDVISRVVVRVVEKDPRGTPMIDDALRKKWHKEWLTPGDMMWAAERREARVSSGLPVSHKYPSDVPLAGPNVVMEIESTHSSFYLRVGGVMLVFGYVLHIMVSEQWVLVVRRISPNWLDWFYGLSLVSIDTGIFVSKMLGLCLLYCAFVVATRKLPSLK